MKDTDSLVVQAFLSALTLQIHPLPPNIQTQLSTIGENLNIEKLYHLINSCQPLNLEYKTAHNYLINHANQRRTPKCHSVRAASPTAKRSAAK